MQALNVSAGGLERRRKLDAPSCLTFVKQTSITYRPKIGLSFTIFVV